jgi:hypothetical protein
MLQEIKCKIDFNKKKTVFLKFPSFDSLLYIEYI